MARIPGSASGFVMSSPCDSGTVGLAFPAAVPLSLKRRG